MDYNGTDEQKYRACVSDSINSGLAREARAMWRARFPQCKLPDKLRSAETEHLVRRQDGMNRRRCRIERKPMLHRRLLKPHTCPSQVRHRFSNKLGKISGGLAIRRDE
jgi:hypothetical protein